MSRLKMPFDKVSAKDVMKKFSDMAYSVRYQNVFQEAVNITYGCEFRVTTDLSKRMQFSCQICNREMNSENAMAEHYRSGTHMKNLDKKTRNIGESSFVSRASQYARDSLQYRLLISSVRPVGLQMVEEYINSRGSTYYKCILCGAHGKLDIMYHHIIGKKHTEKYIKSGCVLKEAILTSTEREEIRQKLVNIEGVNVDATKIIRGEVYYPYKWEAEGRAAKLYNEKVKEEQRRSISHSPSPGPSSRRSPYPSCRHSRSKKKMKYHKRGRSSSRSSSSSSNSSRGSYSLLIRKYKKTKRRKMSSSCSSSNSSIRGSPRHINRERSPNACIKEEAMSPTRLSNPRAPSVSRDLAAFRNQSPPPSVQVKAEPLSPGRLESVDQGNSLPMPIDPSTIKKEKDNASVQTKVDLDDIMYSFNLFVKNQPREESRLKTREELKGAIDLMLVIGSSLRQLTISCLEDKSHMTPNRWNMLVVQREKCEKIMGYIKKWYLPTWEAESERVWRPSIMIQEN